MPGSRPFSAFPLAALAALLSTLGCFSIEPRDQRVLRKLGGTNDPYRMTLAVPSKDDLFLLDGEPFSITAFERVKELTATGNFDVQLWIGQAALVLQSDFLTRKERLSSDLAVAVARYAAGDLPRAEAEEALVTVYGHRMNIPTQAEARKSLEDLLARAVIVRNDFLIQALRAERRR